MATYDHLKTHPANRNAISGQPGSHEVVLRKPGDNTSKVRHNGHFSSDNPFLDNLWLASNKQDQDALFDLAVKAEAELKTTNADREYAREVLEEQREYDDPLNVAARQRAAGINPDLPGSSGSSGVSGGSSAQENFVQQDQVTTNTPFKNSYQDTTLALQGIQSAANFVSGFASSASALIGAVDTISTLSLRKQNLQANTSLQNAQANEINKLVDPKKQNIEASTRNIDASTVGQNIANSASLMSSLADIAELFPSQTADEMAGYFNTLGITDPADQKSRFGIVEALRSNPELRAKYQKNLRDAAIEEETTKAYTPQYISTMVQRSAQIQEMQQAFDLNMSSLNAAFSALINTEENAELQANVFTTGLQSQQSQNDYNLMVLDREIESFTNKLDAVQQLVDSTTDQIMAIENNTDPQFKNLKAADRKAIADELRAICVTATSLGATELHNFNALARHMNRLIYSAYNGGQNMSDESKIFDDLIFNGYNHHKMSWREVGLRVFEKTVDLTGQSMDGYYNYKNSFAPTVTTTTTSTPKGTKQVSTVTRKVK